MEDDVTPREAEPVPEWNRFRDYLLLLTRMQIREPFRAKIDASDVVQQALLDAHRKREQFRGQTDAELAGWLRQVLASTLYKTQRDLGRAKRDAHRERSIQDMIDASSVRLEKLLAQDLSTPSVKMDRQEQVLRVAQALTQLTDGQREAILLRYCEGWPLLDIAEHMGCKPPTVVGLLKRGSERVREVLREGTE